MKTTAALLSAITLLSVTARAAEPANWAEAAPYRYDRALDDDVQSARALKITGATLTAVGAALQIAAIALGCVDAVARINFFGPARPLGSMTFAAIGAGAGGTALVASGIPLLVIGSRRLRRADARLHFAPVAERGAAGGSVSVSVRF